MCVYRLLNVTIEDISVTHVAAHRYAGVLRKKFDIRSGVTTNNDPHRKSTSGHFST